MVSEAQECADASAALKGADCGTYVWWDAVAAIAYAEALPERFPDVEARPPLYGVPVSVKDCFDRCGHGDGMRIASSMRGCMSLRLENAWIVERLLDAGAVVMGKTHLHQLAYGITGENEDYGNSLQPRDRTLLTGGSSSGAVASVQEGSAIGGGGDGYGRIGAGAGGALRDGGIPGLAWAVSRGGVLEGRSAPGGQSFDTLGLLFEDLRDGPLLGAGGVWVGAASGGVE